MAPVSGSLRAGICEDDDELRGVVRRALEGEGFAVRATSTGGDAVRAFADDPPDVLVLDIGLPDSDGRDVCQALRARGVCAPVLFLTARDALPDRLSGFHAGGDDYLTKPFALAELLVRVQALVRRAGAAAEGPATGLVLDPAGHAVRHDGRAERLTPTEFRLLAALGRAPGRGAAARRAGRRRLARRRDRARQHARRLPGPPAAQAARGRRQRGDRDGARRRVRAAVTFRNRLLATSLLTLIVGLGALVVAGNVLLAVQIRNDQKSLLDERAQALLASVEVRDGRVVTRVAPNDVRLDRQSWVLADGDVLERPASVDPEA